jgi:hypothetical protein
LEPPDQVQHFLKRPRRPAAMAQEDQCFARFQAKSPYPRPERANKTSKRPPRRESLPFRAAKG